MEDKSLPKSVGDNSLAPMQLTVDQEELCKRLDAFYGSASMVSTTRPSDMFRGAMFAFQTELRANSDWIAQVAHSLREILYPFRNGQRRLAIKKYGSISDDKTQDQEVGRYFGLISNLAHHNFTEAGKNPLVGGSKYNSVAFTTELFEKIVFGFQKILFVVLRRQIDAHGEIDGFLRRGPGQANIVDANEFIGLNFDARNYFFAQADEVWLDWLWGNALLDGIKRKPEDATKYSYRMPELDYLARMSKKIPAKVVDIMLSVENSVALFNPEVVDRFLWICDDLPVEQLARLAGKIRDENWVRIMAGFNRSGFEYGKILEKLTTAKCYDCLLAVADSVLSIRTKEEVEKSSKGFGLDNPFYFNDLGHTKIFQYLSLVDDDHCEAALGLATRAMSGIILLGEEGKKGGIFKIQEKFYLYDVDFFTIELGREDHLSHRDDVRDLAVVLKLLLQRLIGSHCDEPQGIRGAYSKYIEPLPDSRSMYRLRLFVFSLCPDVFRREIKNHLFGVFDYGKPWELVSGAEYEHLIQRCFSVLTDSERRDYVARSVGLFSKVEDLKSMGRDLLSSAYKFLTADEIELAGKVFGPLRPDHQPESSIGEMHGGTITPQPPGNDDDWNSPIPNIVKKLKAEWSPRVLRDTHKGADFLRPVDAQGAGDALVGKMPLRISEFLGNATLFFDREVLDPHYTHSYLRGLQGLLKGNKVPPGYDWSKVLGLMDEIRQSGSKAPFEEPAKSRNDLGWLAHWRAVHSQMADLIQQILSGEHGKLPLDFDAFRDALFELIRYLLAHADPSPKDEVGENSEPFTIAINSVRGRAFEALATFLFHDEKRLGTEGKKIAEDAKQLLEGVISREDTQAVMFMVGRNLASFYYRDAKWTRGLMPTIFSAEPTKRHLYLAAWEGYLSNSLYREIFEDTEIQKLYERAISLSPDEYQKHRHFRDLDEGLATHLALAYMHFDEFSFSNPLFKAFWEKPNKKRHGEFIGFIGRMFISGSNEGADDLLKKDPNSRRKLLELWDWALEHCAEAEVLTKFGFWANTEKGLFDLKWLADHVKRTLDKTAGDIGWEYGLTKIMPSIAQAVPETALGILRAHILEGGIRKGLIQRPLYVHDEWMETFRVLHTNPTTKAGTVSLIDDLVREGGSPFWRLKEILKKDR